MKTLLQEQHKEMGRLHTLYNIAELDLYDIAKLGLFNTVELEF